MHDTKWLDTLMCTSLIECESCDWLIGRVSDYVIKLPYLVTSDDKVHSGSAGSKLTLSLTLSSSSTVSALIMASVVVRIHRMHHASTFFATCLGQPSSSRTLLYLPSHRHAMMSALSHDRTSHPHPAPSSSTSSSPVLGETSPIVISPNSTAPSATTLSADADSPQVAARPPPIPRAERRKLTIKATKAAITVV